MCRTLTLGSLFDGSGGFTLGALIAGVVPVWASEIEPFPIRVTTKRLPEVMHLGDINEINGATVPPVDIITGGFCCQDLSVAGKRAGLHGEKSRLFFQVARIIREMRDSTGGKYPRAAVLENVPGMYSSNRGHDFLEVINELIHIKDSAVSAPMPEKGKWAKAGEVVGDGFSLAWRTLDAQFWGVAQRRRRCYIVVDFDGECAGEVLFDETRLRGDPPAGSFAREATARDIAEGTCSTVHILNDQGGGFMNVSEGISGTLRAQENGHQPIVLHSSGFCTEHSADSRGIRYEAEKRPTLRAGVVPGTIVANEPPTHSGFAALGGSIQAALIDNHPQDGRVTFSKDGVTQTLTGRAGTGGGNVPLVMNERQYALTVSEGVANTLTETDYKGVQCLLEPKTLKIRSGCEGGGKGPLIQENISATLSTGNEQTVFVPKPFGISSYDSNAMKSDNPHAGIYQANTSRTLDANGGHPGCNQGGIAVVFDSKQITSKDNRSNPKPSDPCHTLLAKGAEYSVVCMEGNAMRPSHRGTGIGENVAFTLNTVERHNVCYQDRVGALCASDYKFPQSQQIDEGKAVVESYREFGRDKDPKASCEVMYAVRRLTPQECALLQGFPADYCYGLETAEPTESEIDYWQNVWETHRRIMGKSKRSRSRNQIIKWLKNPHSDSAEYKMWGNGVALPCVVFVLGGIAHYMK